MNAPQSRQDALNQITALAEAHGLTRHDLLKAIEAGHKGEQEASLLQKVLSYIGGAFVFCGLATYVGMVWEDLDSLSRVIITLGSGFVAFILGLLALGDQRFIRASTPILLIAATLQPVGLFVFMDEYLPKTGDIVKASCFVFGFMLLQQALAFFARPRTSLLFFTLFFFYAFMSPLMELAGIDPQLAVLAMGISGLLVCSVVQKTEHHGVVPFFLFCSGIAITAASFDYLENSPFDVGLIGIVAGLVYLSVLMSSRTLLTISIIALLAYLVYFTDEYFKDVVGWPLALVLVGLIMIGISSYAVKLGKRMGSPQI